MNEYEIYSVVNCPSENQISRPNSSEGLLSLQSSIRNESLCSVIEFDNPPMISDDQKPASIFVDICPVTDSEECNTVLIKEKSQLDGKEF